MKNVAPIVKKESENRLRWFGDPQRKPLSAPDTPVWKCDQPARGQGKTKAKMDVYNTKKNV